MPKYCSNCGAEIGESSKFCGSCGSRVDPVSELSHKNDVEENTVQQTSVPESVSSAAVIEETESAVSFDDDSQSSGSEIVESEAAEKTKNPIESAEDPQKPEIKVPGSTVYSRPQSSHCKNVWADLEAKDAENNVKASEAAAVKKTESTSRKSVWDDLEKKESAAESQASEKTSSKKPQPVHYKGVWDDIEKKDGQEEKRKSNSQLIPIIASILVVAAIGVAIAFKMGVFGNDGNQGGSGDKPIAVQTEDPADTQQSDSGNPEDSNVEETPVTAADEQKQDEVKPVLIMETEAGSDERNLVLKSEKHEISDGPIGYVDVKTARIRVRKGPSTSSTDTKKRTAVGDKYDVYEKTTGEGYNWYRISNNNEWIADDNGKWMKFTAYEYKAPDQVKPKAAADSYYAIYRSYIDSINHGGDFSYLKNTGDAQLESFRSNYSKYCQDYSFEINEFNADLTDIQIVETKNGYDALIHAYTVNTSTDLKSGEKQENEVKLLARLSYKDESGEWTLVWQRSDSEYDPSGHEMYPCK